MVADRTTTLKPRSTLFVGLTLLVLLVFVAWKLSTTLLLVFAGVLLSILFSRMANRLSNITRWSRTWSLMAELAAIVAILIALAMWIGPQPSSSLPKCRSPSRKLFKRCSTHSARRRSADT